MPVPQGLRLMAPVVASLLTGCSQQDARCQRERGIPKQHGSLSLELLQSSQLCALQSRKLCVCIHICIYICTYVHTDRYFFVCLIVCRYWHSFYYYDCKYIMYTYILIDVRVYIHHVLVGSSGDPILAASLLVPDALLVGIEAIPPPLQIILLRNLV